MAENNVENDRAFPVEINPEKTPLPHITGITVTALFCRDFFRGFIMKAHPFASFKTAPRGKSRVDEGL